jgi:hypothetical protein
MHLEKQNRRESNQTKTLNTTRFFHKTKCKIQRAKIEVSKMSQKILDFPNLFCFPCFLSSQTEHCISKTKKNRKEHEIKTLRKLPKEEGLGRNSSKLKGGVP